MWKGLSIASALVLAAAVGVSSADAKPKGYGFGPPGHGYAPMQYAYPPGWSHGKAWWKYRQVRHYPPGWYRGKAWWKPGHHPGWR